MPSLWVSSPTVGLLTSSSPPSSDFKFLSSSSRCSSLLAGATLASLQAFLLPVLLPPPVGLFDFYLLDQIDFGLCRVRAIWLTYGSKLIKHVGLLSFWHLDYWISDVWTTLHDLTEWLTCHVSITQVTQSHLFFLLSDFKCIQNTQTSDLGLTLMGNIKKEIAENITI